MSHDHRGHAHDHNAHGHGHAHGHAPANFGKAFAIGMALNLGFVVIEAAYGIMSNSVSLLADAGHNLGDVLGLGVAWLASVLARRAPTARCTYGMRGSSILAALVNAVFLLVTVGGLSWEAIRRIGSPEPVAGMTMMAVAGDRHPRQRRNGVAVRLRPQGRHQPARRVPAYGVGRARVGRRRRGWAFDPADGLAMDRSGRQPRHQRGDRMGHLGPSGDSVGMSMAAVPPQIDPAAVRGFLAGREGVIDVHDLHIWPMSTTENALTCHLVMPNGHPGDAFLNALCSDLAERFKINHTTVQIEVDPHIACALAPDEVV